MFKKGHIVNHSSKKIYLFPATMLGITAISGTIAMMTSVSADNLSSVDDNIAITVDSACTMGQTVLQSGNTLNPGETSTIGQSRIAAYCNDSEGYAIYAIGYTNSEYGNTNLVSTSNSNYTIPTGTSGSSSYWNMRLTQGTATGPVSYQPTMVNTFTTNATIPDDYTKVAYRDSNTISQNQDPTETGSYFTTTYEAHIDTTQPAGIYNGQVQYVMVHPSSAYPPKTIKSLTYMQEFATLSINDKASVLASMPEGAQYTLKDSRDQKDYYVSKLADGNIWMTQNLDLVIDSTKTYTPADTDISSNWTPTTSTSTNSSWNNSYFGLSSYDPGNRYWRGTISTISSTINSMSTSGDPHYHIGNYYNWTAAVAMNDTSSYTGYEDVNQSICPAGWRLPKYSGDKSFLELQNAQKFTSGPNGNIQSEPAYFVYGGGWSGSSFGVNSSGIYRTNAISGNGGGSRVFDFNANGNLRPQSDSYRGSGYPVRCVSR